MADPRDVRAAILDVVAGGGPLQRLFDGDNVEEFWWNEPNRVFGARTRRSELTTIALGETQVYDLVERTERASRRRVDMGQPFVGAVLPGSVQPLPLACESSAAGGCQRLPAVAQSGSSLAVPDGLGYPSTNALMAAAHPRCRSLLK